MKIKNAIRPLLIKFNSEDKMKTKDLIKKINKLIPEAKAIKASEFYNDSSRDGIWFKGSEDYASDDLRIFGRNSMDSQLFKIRDDLELALRKLNGNENVHLRIGRATAIINKIVRDLKEQEINLEEYYGSMNYETTE
jgi:uncharacterized protein (DUF1499 family)